MGSEIDRVWAIIKSHARKVAASGQVVSFGDAKKFVARLWASECFERPEDGVLDFFANELVTHVIEYRRTLSTNSERQLPENTLVVARTAVETTRHESF